MTALHHAAVSAQMNSIRVLVQELHVDPNIGDFVSRNAKLVSLQIRYFCYANMSGSLLCWTHAVGTMPIPQLHAFTLYYLYQHRSRLTV